jgi:hypothetical protein
MTGTVGPLDRSQLAAAAAPGQQEAAAKKQEQREKYDLALRASFIREGTERPAGELLGLGVVA